MIDHNSDQLHCEDFEMCFNLATLSSIPEHIENKPFPHKLFYLLEDEQFKGVIEWLPCGKAFQIVNIERFTEDVSPIFFKHSKLASFQRQLNLYGFRRYTETALPSAYFNGKFRKDKPELLSEMKRNLACTGKRKVCKGTKSSESNHLITFTGSLSTPRASSASAASRSYDQAITVSDPRGLLLDHSPDASSSVKDSLKRPLNQTSSIVSELSDQSDETTVMTLSNAEPSINSKKFKLSNPSCDYPPQPNTSLFSYIPSLSPSPVGMNNEVTQSNTAPCKSVLSSGYTTATTTTPIVEPPKLFILQNINGQDFFVPVQLDMNVHNMMPKTPTTMPKSHMTSTSESRCNCCSPSSVAPVATNNFGNLSSHFNIVYPYANTQNVTTSSPSSLSHNASSATAVVPHTVSCNNLMGLNDHFTSTLIPMTNANMWNNSTYTANMKQGHPVSPSNASTVTPPTSTYPSHMDSSTTWLNLGSSQGSTTRSTYSHKEDNNEYKLSTVVSQPCLDTTNTDLDVAHLYQALCCPVTTAATTTIKECSLWNESVVTVDSSSSSAESSLLFEEDEEFTSIFSDPFSEHYIPISTL